LGIWIKSISPKFFKNNLTLGFKYGNILIVEYAGIIDINKNLLTQGDKQ